MATVQDNCDTTKTLVPKEMGRDSKFPLTRAIERVNEQVLAVSALEKHQIEYLRDPKFPIRSVLSDDLLTTNWTARARKEFPKWMAIAEKMIENYTVKELATLDPYYGVLVFGLNYAASKYETVPVAMVRIICALASEPHIAPLGENALCDFLRNLLCGFIMPPTPLLLNSGNINRYSGASASCFVLAGPEECIKATESLYTMKKTHMFIEHTTDVLSLIAKMSLNGGAIGMNISSCPMGSGPGACLPTSALYSSILENYPQTKYRKATGTLYLETWHADIVEFMGIHHPQSIWLQRTHRVFPAVWINDAFMVALRDNLPWYLFDPASDARIKRLVFLYGEEFTRLYEVLVQEKRYVACVAPRDIFAKLAQNTIATGGPFVLFKDQINRTSCHSEIYGPITSSNLCTEIIQYHDQDQIATCSLVSINVDRVLRQNGNSATIDDLDFTLLRDVMRSAVHVTTFRTFIMPNIGHRIKNHSQKSRPIGVGIQGYADLLISMGIAYVTSGDILRKIFEHMYYYGLEMSCDLVSVYGRFENFEASYYARGGLHFDQFPDVKLSSSLDWEALRRRIASEGLVNSLLIAQMPTSHSATTWNSSEWFEPLSRPVERKKTAVGDCIAIIKALQDDPILCERVVAETLQFGQQTHFESGWNMSMQEVLNVWKEAIPFIDQSASLSWYLNGGVREVINGLIFCWRHKFKTALYYMRVQPHGTNKQFLKNTLIKSSTNILEEGGGHPVTREADPNPAECSSTDCMACIA